ncbi:hypothetical protein LZC95_37500 [Pendulispora brunnea]|uniref:Cytochrome c domain-containing protein n=1 Tax=Pendulispora brunnea TaxID=2905690 RepID=A0ABZ2K4J1_9BACT
MRRGPGKAQVGWRVGVVAVLPAAMLIGAGSLGACSSSSGSTPDGTDDGDGNAPDLGPRGGGDGSSSRDAEPDVSSDAFPVDSGSDAQQPSDAAPDVVTPIDTGPPLDCTAVGSAGEPKELGCTGLYASWPDRSIAPSARPFTPAFTSWSDGAYKSRWIYLPPGTKIDTSNMDEWRFPVGTKIWKEFRLGNLRVETRLLWKKTNSDWYRTAYVWSRDQSSATENTAGVVNIWGTGYDVVPQSDCSLCHNGHLDGVLGFEAIGLSAAGASGFTMSALVSEQRVTDAPASSYEVPGDATARAALGSLHANCGNACHSNSNYALAKDSGLFMRLRTDSLGSVAATDTYKTAVGVASKFQPPGQTGFLRIKENDVAHSTIPYRDGYRDTSGERIQMPPLGTHKVDTAAMNAVKAWINAM